MCNSKEKKKINSKNQPLPSFPFSRYFVSKPDSETSLHCTSETNFKAGMTNGPFYLFIFKKKKKNVNLLKNNEKKNKKEKKYIIPTRKSKF